MEQRLRERLRQPDATVPPAVDAAVLDAGRRAAAGFRIRRRWLVRIAGATAAAAAALVAVALWLGAAERGFDVADAWRVAAGLEHRARFDQNGDGRVDGADAEQMLRAIVALGPRRGS